MPFAAAEIIATKKPRSPINFSFICLYLQAAAHSAQPQESRTSRGLEAAVFPRLCVSALSTTGQLLPRNCSELKTELSQPLLLVWTTSVGTVFSRRKTTTSTAGQVSGGLAGEGVLPAREAGDQISLGREGA